MIKTIKRRSRTPFSLLPSYNLEVMKNRLKEDDISSDTPSVALRHDDGSSDGPLSAEPRTATA
jgi:hypothetical protein